MVAGKPQRMRLRVDYPSITFATSRSFGSATSTVGTEYPAAKLKFVTGSVMSVFVKKIEKYVGGGSFESAPFAI